MCDYYDRYPKLYIDIHKQFKDRYCGLGIKCRCWVFVAEQYLRFERQCLKYAYTLFLASAKVADLLIFLLCQSYKLRSSLPSPQPLS